MKYIINKIKIIFIILGLSGILLSQAAEATFGFSCSMPTENQVPIATSDYLSRYTTYGYIKSLIDISNCGNNYENSCGLTEPDSLTICVRKTVDNTTSANAQNSNKITLNIRQVVSLGNITSLPEVQGDPNLADIKLGVFPFDDLNQLCLVTPTIYGYMPLLCRQVKAPIPITKINDDMSKCSTISRGCDLYSSSNPSRTAENFFGSAVQCVYESLNLIFFDPTTCDKTTINTLENITNTAASVKPFAKFFSTLRTTVSAAITLYVIFFGIRMALSPTEITIFDGFIAVLKMAMVIYFSVGSTMFDWFTGKVVNNNGITQLVLPMMISFTDTMSSYIFNNSSTNNLCYFDLREYQAGYAYYSLWDSLDCRLNTYLGNAKIFWDNLSSFTRVSIPGELSSSTPSIILNTEGLPDSMIGIGGEIVKSSVAIAFFPMIFAMLLGGGIFPFALLIFVMIIIIGLSFSMVMSYIVSIVILYILAYIAPIFVPMALFERTKAYYNNWLNLCIGSALQPVVIVSFGAFALTLIDSFLFDQCGFAKYSYFDSLGNMKYIFQLRILDSDTGGACQASIGYKLFQYYQSSAGWHDKTFIFFKITTLSDIWDIEGSLWTGAVMCFFMRYLLDKIYDISSDLTEGMDLGSVAVKPMVILNSAIAAGKAMSQEKENIAQKLAAEMAEGDKKGGGSSGRSTPGEGGGGDAVSGASGGSSLGGSSSSSGGSSGGSIGGGAGGMKG